MHPGKLGKNSPTHTQAHTPPLPGEASLTQQQGMDTGHSSGQVPSCSSWGYSGRRLMNSVLHFESLIKAPKPQQQCTHLLWVADAPESTARLEEVLTEGHLNQ